MAPSESSPSARRRATTSLTCSPSMRPPAPGSILRGCARRALRRRGRYARARDGADTLYTRLRGGRDVKISKKAVIARSPAAIARSARATARRAGLCLHRRLSAAGGRRRRRVSVARAERTGRRPAAARPAGHFDPAARAGRQAHVEMGATGTRSRGRGAGAQRRRGRGRGGRAPARFAQARPRRHGLHELHARNGARRSAARGTAPALLAVSAAARVVAGAARHDARPARSRSKTSRRSPSAPGSSAPAAAAAPISRCSTCASSTPRAVACR